MTSIRLATPQDAIAIARVHVASWRTTYAGIVAQAYLDSLDEAERALQWQTWLDGDVEVFIAVLDGDVVGFASGGPIREPLDNCDAELYAIYLLARAQRRGLGTALLKTVATSLHGKDFKSMAVWVLERNPATHFYEESGAVRAVAKQIEIGGALLEEIALVWRDLSSLTPST